MSRFVAIFILGFCTSAAANAAEQTNFGVRTVGAGPPSAPISASLASASAASTAASWTPLNAGKINLSAIAALGAQWGRVTSTYRSPEHNRRVGGVRNSYHLRGRAIDIARRAGVSHWQIAAAFRAAGYHLVESLDEGDHSHFAFGTGAASRPAVMAAQKPSEVTAWRVVSAPGALR